MKVVFEVGDIVNWTPPEGANTNAIAHWQGAEVVGVGPNTWMTEKFGDQTLDVVSKDGVAGMIHSAFATPAEAEPEVLPPLPFGAIVTDPDGDRAVVIRQDGEDYLVIWENPRYALLDDDTDTIDVARYTREELTVVE